MDDRIRITHVNAVPRTTYIRRNMRRTLYRLTGATEEMRVRGAQQHRYVWNYSACAFIPGTRMMVSQWNHLCASSRAAEIAELHDKRGE